VARKPLNRRLSPETVVMLKKLSDAIGHLLQGQHAGLDKILFNIIDLRQGTARIRLTSPAFADHAPLPRRCTADGEGVSPPLDWDNIPAATESLALIVEDADSPTPAPLVHAIAVDIDPLRKELLEGELQETESGRNTTLSLGRNSYLRQAWLPPDPPPGHGVHRYAFQLFALADGARFSGTPGRDDLAEAIRNRGIASGCLIGTYTRDNPIKADKAERASEPALTDPLAGEPAIY
jgi:Raf kinase inhibitor-like YbhB/YbcL family protein